MTSGKYLLGFDVGSSSVKASVIDSNSGKLMGSATSPKQEMKMKALKPGWAEQDPELWWRHLVKATHELLQNQSIKKDGVASIGISYQMHGLVAVDKNHQVVRPSIIWCDSRASDIGKDAFEQLGEKYCLEHFLNSPGNFTASKLKWVKENEPEIYNRIHKIMLPGDYIAMKMTGDISTTTTGLSEGILWDYKSHSIAGTLLEHFGISEELIPLALSSFTVAGELTETAANELGLQEGVKIAYRAGDQPNNAFSLNVLNPGEAATTAGTSGVIYAVTDQPLYDKQSRVNTFVHVNNRPDQPRNGVLLCVNGTGILNSWLKNNLSDTGKLTYPEMNRLAHELPAGSGGVILPFGNGAERILENRDIGAQFLNIHFNRHNKKHLFRAAQEGIVFSMNYGFQIMKSMNVIVDKVKAGKTNMFQSPLFREAFVNTTGTVLELYNTDGSEGAARGGGVGAGIFSDRSDAFRGLTKLDVIEPDKELSKIYNDLYHQWYDQLKLFIN